MPLARSPQLLADFVPAVVPVTLEVFEVVQRLLTVENPDVLRLGRRQTTDRPAQMHEVRLDRCMQRVHSDFARQVVRLPGVARAARGYDVRPVVRPAAGERDEMVAREGFARLELDLKASAVLTAVASAREEEGVRYLSAEAAWDVDEPHQSNHCRTRQ